MVMTDSIDGLVGSRGTAELADVYEINPFLGPQEPDLFRAPTSLLPSFGRFKTWMAGTSPATGG